MKQMACLLNAVVLMTVTFKHFWRSLPLLVLIKWSIRGVIYHGRT